ncbi:DASH family cryptochrome [Thaumasiovibrio subtropicus]|uniref:DASH family cryptochrome n=1 Tax=Thaumasiovibrio subtropicus TaxID=1891207 RepID=UPI00192D0BC6|nr:DASH family cryptochrome [Thaumasiovibrio subtropicus]
MSKSLGIAMYFDADFSPETSSSRHKTGIYWFGNDQRIADNPLLTQACEQCDRLVLVYCIEPQFLRTNRYITGSGLSTNRWRALMESLNQLSEQLADRGQQLLLKIAPALDMIPALMRCYNATVVYRASHAGVYERQQWQILKSKYPYLEYVSDEQLTLFGSVAAGLDDFAPTFSQFRRHVEGLPIAKPVVSPAFLPPSPANERTRVTPASGINSGGLIAGELNGQCHLASYFKTTLPSRYKETRNHLGAGESSTQMSLYLSHGNLSPRQIVAKLRDYEALHGENESTYWIYFELLWREFFFWHAVVAGSQLYAFSGQADTPPLLSAYPERYRRWVNGQTAHPLVNACMNELRETGYLSNRGRQIVASCLVNELSVDWRFGAAYFEQQLVDYDVGSNWGNWQYIAGVGCDAKGGRHFNLDKQQALFDCQGHYVKRWQGDIGVTRVDTVDAADWPLYP